MNRPRCCAISEILWSHSRLPEISKFKKSEMATLSLLHKPFWCCNLMIIVFLKMCILNVIGTVDFSMFDLAICLVLNLGVQSFYRYQTSSMFRRAYAFRGWNWYHFLLHFKLSLSVLIITAIKISKIVINKHGDNK